MSRRAEWQKVLDIEVARWSGKTWQQLVQELRELQAYQFEVDSKQFQVEVELLEDTKDYLHVIVAVDDGTLPMSISPSTHDFIKQKSGDAN